MKSCEFVVPTRTDEECPEGYEEMTFEDFFEKYELTDVEQKEFINKHYAINIHWCYHSENIHKIHGIISDIKNDPRLSKLNAIVFLALKTKGRGKAFKPVSFNKFKDMVNRCLHYNIRFGFDSCSCNNFLKAVEDHPKYEQFKTVAEPCESTCFSSYIDVHGKFYPCSFCEKIKGWEEGLDVVNCEDFLTDIWGNAKTVAFRDNLLNCGRSCPVYKI